MKCFGVLALVVHPFVTFRVATCFSVVSSFAFLSSVVCRSLARSVSPPAFSLSRHSHALCVGGVSASLLPPVTGGKRRDQRLSRLLSKRVLMLFYVVEEKARSSFWAQELFQLFAHWARLTV